MQLTNTPGKLVLPFANAGVKNTIPTASQIGITAGAASLTDGFPPLTRTPIAAGGVPPSGLDMNGILFQLSAILRWANAGGGYAYDSTFANDSNVGGYPKGARIMRSDGLGYWFNTVENNTTDPEAAGAAAAGWVPDFTNGVTSVAMASANVTLTPLQYGKPIIVITGTLTANLNLIFPTIVNEWTVINNTTGGYTITAKTAAGIGVGLVSGFVGSIVGDGVNIGSTLAALLTNGGADLIQFAQAGTGAVSRSVQNKLRELISVFDFMTAAQIADVTAGTATLDVSASLQAAINAANNNWLYMPAGTYRIDTALQLNNQTDTSAEKPAVKLVGAGVSKTKILNRSADYALKHTSTSAQAAARSMACNGVISDMTIYADGSSPTGAAGIELQSFWFGRIEDVELSALKGHGLATPRDDVLNPNSDLYACGSLELRRVNVGGCTGWGIYNDNPSNSLSIANCYIVNNDIGGAFLGGAANLVIDSAITGNARGVGGICGLKLAYTTATPHNNYVRGIEFDNNYIKHLIVEGYHHTVEKCRFIQDGTGGTYKAPICVSIDGTNSGYPQENTLRDCLFRFDNPGPSITAVSIPDSINTTGNLVANNHFSTTKGVTKYAFAGTTRARNLAIEDGRQVYGVVQLPYLQNALAVAVIGNALLLNSTPQVLNLNSSVIDTNAAFSAANKRFTAPYSGVLKISFNGKFRSITTANVAAALYVKKNGSTYHTQSIPQGFGALGVDQNYSFVLSMLVAAGDQIELWGSVSTNDTLYSIGDATATTTFEMM